MDGKLVLAAITLMINIYSVESESCSIPILSVDHSFGSSYLGQYFNFDRRLVHNLGIKQELRFTAYNPRTSIIGEVVVWGSANGGSIGDAHGRFNAKNVAPKPGQWKTGDKLVPVDYFYCEKAKCESCSIPILSVDHAFGSNYLGQYFNFNRRLVNNLGINQERKFIAYNPRTSVVGEVVVWGSAYGGSIGDAHGRFNSKNVEPKPGQWKTGDKLVPVDGSNCKKVKTESCSIPILSVDHAFGRKYLGQYFNFDRRLVNNLGIKQELRFIAYNPRTSTVGEVVVWRSANGGSIGDAHGRFNSKNVAPKPGQWRTGDKLIPIDSTYCRKN